MCIFCTFFCAFASSYPSATGFFRRFRLRDTQELRPNTTAAHVWVPAELRGACSGRPTSCELALFKGIAFRPAGPSRTMETPKCKKKCHSLCCPILLRHWYNSSRASKCFPLWLLRARACVCACVCVCVPCQELGAVSRRAAEFQFLPS